MFTSSTKKFFVCGSSYWVLLWARKLFNIVGSTIKEKPNDEFINGLTKILCVCSYVNTKIVWRHGKLFNKCDNVYTQSMNKMLWKFSMFLKCKCMHIGQPMANNNGRKVPILVQKQNLDLH